jgi:hypothetical protein
MQRVDDQRPWLTPDFELKFRQALGREMTAEERAFFGVKRAATNSGEESPKANEDEGNR